MRRIIMFQFKNKSRREECNVSTLSRWKECLINRLILGSALFSDVDKLYVKGFNFYKRSVIRTNFFWISISVTSTDGNDLKVTIYVLYNFRFICYFWNIQGVCTLETIILNLCGTCQKNLLYQKSSINKLHNKWFYIYNIRIII